MFLHFLLAEQAGDWKLCLMFGFVASASSQASGLARVTKFAKLSARAVRLSRWVCEGTLGRLHVTKLLRGG